MAEKLNVARNHHWIPQFYLRGFCSRTEANSRLWTYDFKSKKAFFPNPRNVGSARDFNRVDIQDLPIDALETAYSGFEAEVNEAIQGMVESNGGFPNSETRNLIINFIALLAVRNPRLREQQVDFKKSTSAKIMQAVLSSKETYEHYVQKAKAEGDIDVDNNTSYEEALALETSGDYKVEVSREFLIRQEVKLHDTLLTWLGRRFWMVVRLRSEAASFITCDHPVCLRTTSLSKGLRFGYGHKNTIVLFPLTSEMFLVGKFDELSPSMEADERFVARLNTVVMSQSERQIYARNGKFQFIDPKTQQLLTGEQIDPLSFKAD